MKLRLVAVGMLAMLACASVSRAETLNSSAFTGPIGQASVSPDGKRIAFQKKTAAGWRIFVGNVDGSGQEQITNGPGDDVEPNWRPDGAVIAFASRRTGNWDLFSIHPDGMSLRALTHTPIDERYPQWSPRAFELEFEPDPLARKHAKRSKAGIAPSDLALLKSLADGSSTWSTFDAELKPHVSARYYKLLFVEGQAAKRRIATMREDGRMRQTLSTGIPGANINPCWDHSAKSIAFVVHRGAKDQAYVADYPMTTDLNNGEGKPKFGIDLAEFKKGIKPVGERQPFGLQVMWTPNGDYVAEVAGQRLTLTPRPGLNLLPVTVATATVSPFGCSWLSDARTVVYTAVNGVGGGGLQTVTLPGAGLDIVDANDFEDLSLTDRAYLDRNGFVAQSSGYKQMFSIYEPTDYQNLPVFISSDSLCHLNHLLFDYTLRTIESEKMMPTTIDLVARYLSASLRQAQAARDPMVAKNALANAAFFAVAGRLILGDVATGADKPEHVNADDPVVGDRAEWRSRQDRLDKARIATWSIPLRRILKLCPPSVITASGQEIKLIRAHQAMDDSPIFGGELFPGNGGGMASDTRINYTEFIPRGHYTRSEMLRRYFLVSRWLGAGPFRRDPVLTQRALLILAATDPVTLKKWKSVQRVVTQFIGDADDQDLLSYRAVADLVYGVHGPVLAEVADTAKARAFADRVAQLPGPKIAPLSQPSFRFYPAPGTPDAELMQGLVYNNSLPGVGTVDKPRYFALGLDVMAVLGSNHAHEMLSSMQFGGAPFDFGLKETEYANYDRQYQVLRAMTARWSEADWTHNLYRRILYALLPLVTAQPDKSEIYLQSPAWQEKQLNTALATWAELKHDTLPKQPTAIEMGGEGGISEAPLTDVPVGYVEPAPEVYRRLEALVRAERAVLVDAGYLTPDLKQRLDTFEALLGMVRRLETKQRSGKDFNAAEIEQLRFFGGFMEHLTMITREGGAASLEDDDMAIIADVASANIQKLGQQLVLEEGVGHALPIYVAVFRHGHRVLTRGAIFSYHEFTHPADDRLTDEKWREMLNQPKAPKMPDWTKSFVSEGSEPESPAANP